MRASPRLLWTPKKLTLRKGHLSRTAVALHGTETDVLF